MEYNIYIYICGIYNIYNIYLYINIYVISNNIVIVQTTHSSLNPSASKKMRMSNVAQQAQAMDPQSGSLPTSQSFRCLPLKGYHASH